jgi:hypothetical protein
VKPVRGQKDTPQGGIEEPAHALIGIISNLLDFIGVHASCLAPMPGFRRRCRHIHRLDWAINRLQTSCL